MEANIAGGGQKEAVEPKFRHGDGKKAANAADNGFEQRISMLSVKRGKARDHPGTRQEDQGYGQEEDSCREK